MPHDTDPHTVVVPPPHQVRARPWLALTLALAAVVVVVLALATPAGSAPVVADCMSVDVGWDGDVVTSIDVEVLQADEDVAPRVTAQVLGAGNASLWREQVTGESVISWAPSVGPASVVVVEEGWQPGALCRVLVNAPDVGPVDGDPEPPAYAPPAPPAGDHRPADVDTSAPAPAGEQVTRTLHSR